MVVGSFNASWIVYSGIVHLEKKTSKRRMNIAVSKQKLTFILTGYRDVLRVSLFADCKRILNEGLQPQEK